MTEKTSNGVKAINKSILGTKGRMTQVFDDKGIVRAATVITAGPITVTQIKSKETDGYAAVQFGYVAQKESRLSKAQSGKLFRYLRESKLAEGETVEAGQTMDVSVFAPGDLVEVSAISKGKGFQGVVKRHGFRGGPRSHGQKNKERAPGSIGGGARAGGRVAKGMRMGGRMGGDRITVRNLIILQVDVATNTLVISGAVPGSPGTLIEIRG
jgi:large subunit ribosomal protein L3